MTYRKIGKGKYVEFQTEPVFDPNIPEHQRVLYKTHIKQREYVLYGNGVIKCMGITGHLCRICMKPNEGKIYAQVDGVNELMRRMLNSNKLTSDQKYDYSNRLGAEYFTPQVIAEIQCGLGDLSCRGSTFQKSDWNGLVQRKQDEQRAMNFLAEQEEKKTFELIEALKNNKKITCTENE